MAGSAYVPSALALSANMYLAGDAFGQPTIVLATFNRVWVSVLRTLCGRAVRAPSNENHL